MIPGPDRIITCPKCRGLARHSTILSGNTSGARIWTDGKRIAPMLPLPPAVVKCGDCGECYWLADAKEPSRITRWMVKIHARISAWEPDYVEEPGEADYYVALQKRLARNLEQERTLRILVWWCRNDAFREDTWEQSRTTTATSDSWKRNLEILLAFLDESDEGGCLMKTEVLRELGKFEAAKQVLANVTSPELAAVVGQFQTLVDAGDTQVRELQLHE